jgi:hypothetical protein
MPNQKISELTAIVTVDNSVDVLPIVDISANTTKKVTPNALKTALALDNVNNTSDANKPVSTAQQDALNAKVTGNTAIVAATKTKITYDAKGLVTAGDILDAADMPTGINAANIGTGVVSSTEFGYLDGVTSAIQTQLNAKQATLVSGTNIKTVNSTSLLGSGDITIAANPSGVSGAIQFSNGSAFASDAANLFWDDTNNRLGVGTNAPSALVHVKGASGILIDNSDDTILAFAQNGITKIFMGWDSANLGMYWYTSGPIMNLSNAGNLGLGGVPLPTARLQVKGSGTTSGTTSLLVQNSAGAQTMKLDDSGRLFIDANNYISSGGEWRCDINFVINGTLQNSNSGYVQLAKAYAQSGLVAGTTTLNASAILQADSTTKGFLPPRMTTTEKNAIASPAAGLVVYDSTTNKLCCYNGSTWNDLF